MLIKNGSWHRLHWLLVTTVVLLAALALRPHGTQAQFGCAVAKAGPNSVPRWLEGCGKVDPNGNPEAVARGVLAGQAKALGLQADGRDLNLLAVNSATGVTYVRFAQAHQGVPVYLGQVLVQYGPDGTVQLINNHTRPNLAIDVTPAIDAATAAATALAQVPGSDQLRTPLTHELVIYGEGKAPELAWHIILYTLDPPGDWHVMVSARSGAVLGAWDEIWHDTGSGLGYSPNAVQQSGDTGLTDNADVTNATLDAARVTLTLTNLLSTTDQLKGSYVDTTGAGVLGCTSYTPATEPTRVYSYTRDDERFEEVTVYAAIDGAQSWFQSLGFNNVNNRAIPVNVHCNNADNSFYSSADDALHFGDGGVDDAEDADIAIHEYGHSVHDNQVPGWGPSGDTEQRAMGEGFGDFLAGMYYIDQGDPTFLNTYKYCIGEWDATFYNPVVGGDSGSGCLRWIDGRNETNGANIGAYSGTPSEEHADGRFWSTALTCIYEGLGADTTARDQVMRLVLQHHFSLTPDNSNQAFEDAVNALRLADLNLFGGANQTLIVDCTLARNLISQPQLLAPTITTPAEGIALVADSSITITWDTNGAPASATYQIEYAVCDLTPIFSDTVENGSAGWTTSHVGGSLDWTQVISDAHSPTHSWFAGDEGAVNDQYLVSPTIPLSGSYELVFWHKYDLEDGYDGGVVEISTNDGGSWSDLGPNMTSNGYNAPIANGFNSPIADRQAFSGTSADWIETLADLSSFDGQTVRLRFRQADDDSQEQTGWWVDDIAVRELIVWTPLVTTTAGASSYNWTTPATPGSYCLRLRGQAPGYLDSDNSPVRTFILDTPPTISDIADQTVSEGALIPSIGFTISDAVTLADDLTLAGSSSNTMLLPNANIVFGGTGISRTVTLTPALGLTGSATVTITVSDGQLNASDTFELTVSQRPQIYLPLLRRP